VLVQSRSLTMNDPAFQATITRVVAQLATSRTPTTRPAR
jgi:hypothetical protein